MPTSLEDLLRQISRDDGGTLPSGGAGLSSEEKGLLEACVAWEPGGKPLEEDARVQPYLQQDPHTRLKAVRALEQLLIAGRLAASREE